MSKLPNQYQVCEHPPLLSKDGMCHLCEQLDGQTDCLSEVQS